MSKENKIKIVEKPDSIPWDEIHVCLWAAHARNREQGIFMRYPALSGEEIKNKVLNGLFFVALDGNTVVGTAAILPKRANLWCGDKNEEYAYFCFASVLPEYSGMGIYKQLCEIREHTALEKGYTKILYDTNERNTKQLSIALRNGYHKVGLKFYKDHYNILMVKWLDRCPFSDYSIKRHYIFQCIKVKTKMFLKTIFRKVSLY